MLAAAAPRSGGGAVQRASADLWATTSRRKTACCEFAQVAGCGCCCRHRRPGCRWWEVEKATPAPAGCAEAAARTRWPARARAPCGSTAARSQSGPHREEAAKSPTWRRVRFARTVSLAFVSANLVTTRNPYSAPTKTTLRPQKPRYNCSTNITVLRRSTAVAISWSLLLDLL